jgi:hypothetical protein
MSQCPCGAAHVVYRYVIHGVSEHVGFACGHRFVRDSEGWRPVREAR